MNLAILLRAVLALDLEIDEVLGSYPRPGITRAARRPSSWRRRLAVCAEFGAFNG
jgi:hypothetical protein